MSENLWGAIPGLTDLNTPNSILVKQGQFLGDATEGALVGVSVKKTTQSGFSIDFYIQAPRLNNYRYHLFKVTHDVHLYPLTIFLGQGSVGCEDEDTFKLAVREILGNPNTAKIIQALLAQVRDDGEEPF